MFTAVLLLAAGCTHVYTVPDVSLKAEGGQYVVDKKIDLAVDLCLTDDFKTTKWESHMQGDTFIIPIGQQLTKNVTELSDILFRDVAVTEAPGAPGKRPADVVLTPKVVAIERSNAAFKGGETVLTLVLQWKIEDVRNKLIWIDSIKAEGKTKAGSAFSMGSVAEKQAGLLLKDLCAKSLEAMRSSPEINQFAAKKQHE
jgi:hypothetical protein